MSDEQDYFDDDEQEIKSKSQIKREMHALQSMGEELTRLPKSQLVTAALPERLMDAILEYQKISSNVARKRQLQFIGKVMRDVDPEPIQAFLDQINNRLKEDKAKLHRLENWRDRLIAEGDKAIEELVTEAPDIDRQQLRQLIRNAQREAATNKPPKSSRSLFKLLREALG